MKLFDAHFHIIDPKFPLVENQGFLPEAFTLHDYRRAAKTLGITGGALVSGSFQAFDQTYLLDALSKLGPHYVGVTQLPATVSDQEIMELDNAGVRAIRFNLVRGGSEGVEKMETLANRVYEIAGWHSELYVDANTLPELASTLERLPAISIDHLGLSKDGLPHLLKLVEKGAHVKASGFGRLDSQAGPMLVEIANVSPDALMFGSDLPSTRADRPFTESDLTLIKRLFKQELAEKILYSNALALYQPDAT